MLKHAREHRHMNGILDNMQVQKTAAARHIQPHIFTHLCL